MKMVQEEEEEEEEAQGIERRYGRNCIDWNFHYFGFN